MNGIDKYVTEKSEPISLESVEHRVTGKLVAKARPRLKPAVTLSPISITDRERTWIETAEQMMLNFAESSHPIFSCHQRLERGELTSKEKGKKSFSLQQ